MLPYGIVAGWGGGKGGGNHVNFIPWAKTFILSKDFSLEQSSRTTMVTEREQSRDPQTSVLLSHLGLVTQRWLPPLITAPGT